MANQNISSNKLPAIFIVVDDLCSQQILDYTLSNNGYATRCLSSGKLALKAATEEPPDLILIDEMMPDMEGFELCLLLKENQITRFIPVLLLTCLNEKEMRPKGIAAGADDFISKPIDSIEILLRTRNLLLVKQHLVNRL